MRVPNPANLGEAEKPADEPVNNVFPIPDRASLKLLSQAKELIERGRYGDAVRNLGAILDGQEDYFFQPAKNRSIHRSLKAEAQRMIGEMPPEGREIYEASYGDRARATLNAAVAEGDVAAIAEVARRFFHTKAGYEAAFLLGLHHLDRARPLAAALALQRLKAVSYLDRQFEPILSLALASSWLQAGEPEKAKAVLIEFKNQNPNRQLVIGGKNVPLFKENSEALDWLVARVGPMPAPGTVADCWVMFRGDPRRNAASPGSAPLLNMRWEVPAAADPAIEEALQQLYRAKADADQPLLPNSHPLVVDDVVLMRTHCNLLALDFHTGKRLWEVPVEESEEVNANLPGDLDVPFRQNLGINLQNPASIQGLGRVWDDSLFGTLSSDGRLVYSIEDAWSNGGGAVRAATFIGRRMSASREAADFNYLAARDLRTGKLKWALGGPNDQFALPQAETFFLGPPLPLLGQLYAIGEAKGEIRLFVLDPDPEKRRDRVVWSQQLSLLEPGMQDDLLRRTTGVSPSYADGILVCPTSTGAVVAVDLATRSLLWGYHYSQETRENSPRFNAWRFRQYPYGVDPARWSDSSVSIVGGRVLVSPVDSDFLHCLNLADGNVKWKVPRQDDLYVACVHRENVVVAGRNRVCAYRLEDGKAAWNGRPVELPEGVLPSGRGFLSGDKYYLPLSSAEVAAIDLDAGKIARFSKSRKGEIPGNLVCYKGRVLSQNYRGLEAFYQLDAAAAEAAGRLAANPRDAEALCLRGEILLDSGNREEAVECYRKAYEIAAEPRAKSLLRETLLDGLRTEFAASRGRGAEIETLLENSAQRADYLRLMIAGMQAEGEFAAAFDRCQALLDLDPGRAPLESVSKLRSVRRDRWIRACLDSLRSSAKSEFAAQMDAAIAARLKAARADGSIDALRAFLGIFDNQPAADQARAELMEKLKKSGRPLEVEMTLWQSQPVLSPVAGGAALAEAAEFYRQSAQTEAAAASYRWLRSRYGEIVCRDGKTGRQLAEAIPPDDPLRKAIERRGQWPTGKVELAADASRTASNRVSYGRIPLEFRGNRGPYFEDLNLVFDQSRMTIFCYDGFGGEIWQFPLNEENQLQNQSLAFNREGAQVRAWGHVLLIPAGGRLVAIDTLAADRTHPPKVLWAEDGGESRAAFEDGRPIRAAAPMMRFQQPGSASGGNPSGEANFIANRYLCVQRARTLRALDTMDGQTLWQREGIPPSSTIFGDDEYVFVLPPDKPEAMVLRALDGELLGSRKIERREYGEQGPDGAQVTRYAPLTNDCLAAFGRNLLYWRQKGDRRVLEMIDVWQRKSLWPARGFSAKAQCNVLNREVLGILEPSGKFTLVALPGGNVLAETQLEPDNNLAELSLIPYEESYLILTNSVPRLAINSIQSHPVNGGGDKSILRGRLYAIDRQGKLLWPEAVKISNQHLVSGQPQGFPALVFAAHVSESQPNRSTRIRLAVQVIDKRTGRVAYEKEDLPQTAYYFKIDADPEKKTMQLAMQRGAVTLTFTDQPWPTKEELEKLQAEEKKNAPPKSLFKALKNAAEGMFKTPGVEFDE
ncbi:MAG: PQQ-binding-like beta-propeller repeat protein [Pirellulales bacterium]|nr:PQQ-binding-like beta-propeller repeat protein [Pirellulales bacterium]